MPPIVLMPTRPSQPDYADELYPLRCRVAAILAAVSSFLSILFLVLGIEAKGAETHGNVSARPAIIGVR